MTQTLSNDSMQKKPNPMKKKICKKDNGAATTMNKIQKTNN